MENVKKQVREFMRERDWLGQPPADIAKSIVIEAAELLEHFQWNNYFNEEIEKDPALKEEILKELADVFIYCTAMAILLDCNIEGIVKMKLALAAKKYPAHFVKGKLGSKKYREIRQNHKH